jgi:hypothetical protein
MSYKVSKIVKLERRHIGIINYTDSLLDQGYSYRKISQMIIEKYHIGMSYESIRQYDLVKNEVRSEDKNEKKKGELYYRIVPIK